MTTRLAREGEMTPPVTTVDQREERPPRARWRVGQMVGLVIVFLVIFELTCRIEDWIRFRTPFFTPITSQVDLLQHDEHGIHGRPNARFQKWIMNAIGTRGPDVSLPKAPGTVRIVFVGASETFGLTESPGKEFPRQLEDTLNARLATVGCSDTAVARFEVVNAALPGMSLITIEQDVRNRIRRFDADFIALYPTPAQYLFEEAPVAARPDSTGRGRELPGARALRPRFLNRVRTQLKTLLPDFVATWLRRRDTESSTRDKPAGWRFESVPADRMDQYRRNLSALVKTIRSVGATPVLATHANAFMRPGFDDRDLMYAWERFYPRATGPVIVAFDSVARGVTLDVASESKVLAVDVAAYLQRSSDDVFSDFVHFTDVGAARVAEALAPALFAASPAGDACAADE